MSNRGIQRRLAVAAAFSLAAIAFAEPAAAQIVAQSLGWCAPHAAGPADVRAGLSVHDAYGKVVGSIQSVAPDGAIIQSGNGNIRVPVEAFGVCPTGLLLNISAKQFKKLVMSAQSMK